MDEKQARTLSLIMTFIGLCFTLFGNWSALGLPPSQRGWVLAVFWYIIICCFLGVILAAIVSVLWDLIKMLIASLAVIGTIIFCLSLASPQPFSPPLTVNGKVVLLIVTAILWVLAYAMNQSSSNTTPSDSTDYYDY